ncbi:TPA: capsule O-acetyltransferase, partial [Neisseria meningitidis]
LEIDTDFQALGGNNLSSIVDEIFEIYSNPDMRLHKFLC